MTVAADHPVLPVPATRLFGREREIAQVLELLERDEVFLLTLIGAGGNGKTRLALAVAQAALGQFRDGVVFVSLAPIQDGALIASKIAQELGLQDWQGDALESIAWFLSERQMLLVLDNLEHVLEAASNVVAKLRSAKDLKMLTTSRAPLRLAGEHEFPISGLEPAPAKTSLDGLQNVSSVQLLLARAKAIRPDFKLDADNAFAVAEMTRKLVGSPLAIELAAARLRMFSPQVLLEMLNQPLNILSSGARDLPERQRGLRATLDWSFNLLQPAHQQLLMRLGVFCGGFSLEAAEIINGNPEVLEDVTVLVENSLVETSKDSQPARFLLLESVREYALEKLKLAGELETAQKTHVEYALSVVKKAAQLLESAEQAAYLEILGLEHDNIDQALRWCIENRFFDWAWDFISAEHYHWQIRGFLAEARSILENLLIKLSKDDLRFHEVLLLAGTFALRQGDDFAARQHVEKTLLTSNHQTTNHQLLARALMMLAEIELNTQNHEQAENLIRQSLTSLNLITVNQKTPEDNLQFFANLNLLGRILTTANKLLEARQTFELALEYVADLPPHLMALGQANFGNAERLLRNHQRSRQLLELSLVQAQNAKARPLESQALLYLGWLELDENNFSQALEHFTAGIEIARLIGAQKLVHEHQLGIAQVNRNQTASKARDTLSDLTPRELEVIKLLADGKTNKKIASELGMSGSTVHTHLRSIFSKLNVATRAAATRQALEQGLI